MLVVAEQRAHGVPSALDRLGGAHSSLRLPWPCCLNSILCRIGSLMIDEIVGLEVITVILKGAGSPNLLFLLTQLLSLRNGVEGFIFYLSKCFWKQSFAHLHHKALLWIWLLWIWSPVCKALYCGRMVVSQPYPPSTYLPFRRPEEAAEACSAGCRYKPVSFAAYGVKWTGPACFVYAAVSATASSLVRSQVACSQMGWPMRRLDCLLFLHIFTPAFTEPTVAEGSTQPSFPAASYGLGHLPSYRLQVLLLIYEWNSEYRTCRNLEGTWSQLSSVVLVSLVSNVRAGR